MVMLKESSSMNRALDYAIGDSDVFGIRVEKGSLS